MTDLHCSPAHSKYSKDNTCYSDNDLIDIVTSYNKVNPNKINHSDKQKKYIHLELKTKLKHKCGDKESCWLEQDFIDYNLKKELEDAFRPKKPLEWYTNNKTWLNTYDILFVMEQYEKKYTDFVFLGVHPIDFEQKNSSGHCIGDIMCTFNIKQLFDKKKDQFGIVVNTDPHNKGGQHWFAIYCNLNPNKKNFGIFYYDSVASSIEPEMNVFMNHIKEQVKQHFPLIISKKFRLDYNKFRKQYKNTECGVFSIVFLTQCLKNIEFKYICKRMKTDDDINKLRDILYRT
jgi:hypothetical protein